jgi:hypothetical protein
MTLYKKLYPPRHGLTLSPWKMRINEAYSGRGGDTGREWNRWWLWRGKALEGAAMVRLNGDGHEVRSRTYGVYILSVKCDWSNGNGVSRLNWPHLQGYKWVGIMRARPSKAEIVATLEREMERQRREIDKRLGEAMWKAGWSGR